MPLFMSEGRTVFFAHVPKAAGTSVEDYLIRRLGKPSFADSHKRQGVRGTGLIPPASHLSAQDLAELLPPKLDYCFAVVRDPVSRMQSEYRYQSGVSRSSRFSFSTWLRVMLKALSMDRRVYENHIRPQTEMVPEGAEVFHLERGGIEEMIGRLDQVMGGERTDVALQHMNKRPSQPIELRKQDITLIEEAYASDYERFGFERRDKSSLPDDTKSALRGAFAAGCAPLLVAKQRRDWVRAGR
jgi:hypothetical protein